MVAALSVFAIVIGILAMIGLVAAGIGLYVMYARTSTSHTKLVRLRGSVARKLLRSVMRLLVQQERSINAFSLSSARPATPAT